MDPWESSDTIAVVAIGASTLTTLGLFILTTWQRRKDEERARQRHMRAMAVATANRLSAVLADAHLGAYMTETNRRDFPRVEERWHAAREELGRLASTHESPEVRQAAAEARRDATVALDDVKRVLFADVSPETRAHLEDAAKRKLDLAQVQALILLSTAAGMAIEQESWITDT